MNFLVENLLFTSFLSGIVFIITGFVMFKFPPKNINMLYGYRTTRSMKNQEQWDFSQKYSAKLLIFCGVFLILTSNISLLITINNKAKLFISLALIFGSVIFLLFKTENELKKRFP
ncbi:SdpI family protein [Mesoflavibacter sp. SCSIO 43206]|uniref:SdpI family protein n=1 Tax=Mesoflavibacter sp. SCSIO 43206 TaxID=2779362 RepID=UPI001CA8EE3F|nr:SdpI family protein [Mesoflavibacter sp. SCSIO 43206]UAB75889.1 SdpI family protein [Mesoflavibacter sp. SCSIO 43206]